VNSTSQGVRAIRQPANPPGEELSLGGVLDSEGRGKNRPFAGSSERVIKIFLRGGRGSGVPKKGKIRLCETVR